MKRSLIFILCSLVFVGCAKQSTEQGTVPVGNKYATGFAINETDSGILVEVFQPYQYAMECLAAVCNPELIYTPVKGDEIDLGDSMKPSAERVLQSNLDILLAVNYGQYDNLEAARLERLGVPIIYINEWQESSPLARAEWIRVLGALTGRLPQADSVFNEVEMKYEKLTKLKSSISNDQSTKIMSGNNFRGTWYVPSGKNYLAYLFKDAGAVYPFYDNDRETSIPLTVEDCLHYFGDADVWVGAGGNSMAELAQMDEKHTWFKAYQNGRVYNWRKQQLPGGANNFWERGVVDYTSTRTYGSNPIVFFLSPPNSSCKDNLNNARVDTRALFHLR